MTTNNQEIEAGTGRPTRDVPQEETEQEREKRESFETLPDPIRSIREGGREDTGVDSDRDRDRDRSRDRDRDRREPVGITDEPQAIGEEGERTPFFELPSAEPRRRELERQRIEREQAIQRGDPIRDTLFTTRLDLVTGQPLETFRETRQEREFRLRQDAALAKLFGGGTRGEELARQERARFEQAVTDYQGEAFNRLITNVEQVEDSNLSEQEKVERISALIQADFDNFTNQRGLLLTGNIPQAEAADFARAILGEFRRSQAPPLNSVQGADGTFISAADFNALTVTQQRVFLSRGFQALVDFTNRANAAITREPEPRALQQTRGQAPPPVTTRFIGAGGLPGGVFGAGPPTPEQIEAVQEFRQQQGVTATPEPVTRETQEFFEENIEEANRVSRDLLNDREYFDYLRLTGQSREALQFSLENEISLPDNEVADLIRDAEAEARADLPFDPTAGPLGILDPRFALPESALATQLIASAARGVTSAIRSAPGRASEIIQTLKTLEIRAPATAGTGPVPPVITKPRPRALDLSGVGQAIEETDRVRRNLRAQLGREPTDAEMLRAFEQLRRAEQARGETFVTPPREIDPVAEEIGRAISAESQRLQREGFQRLFRRTSAGEIVDAQGNVITPNARQRLRDLGLSPDDFRPLTQAELRTISTGGVPVGVLRDIRGVARAEGEGQILPSPDSMVTQRIGPRAATGAIPATTVFEGEQARPAEFPKPEGGTLDELLNDPDVIREPIIEPEPPPEAPPQPERAPLPTIAPERTVTTQGPLSTPTPISTTGLSPFTGPAGEVSPLEFQAPEPREDTLEELLTNPELITEPVTEPQPEPPPRPPRQVPQPVRLQRTRGRFPDIQFEPETRQVSGARAESVAWRQGGTQWINVDSPYEATNFSFPTSRPIGSRVFRNAVEAFNFVNRITTLSPTARDRWAQFFEQGRQSFDQNMAQEFEAIDNELAEIDADPDLQEIDDEIAAFDEDFAEEVGPVDRERERLNAAVAKEIGPKGATVTQTRQMRRPSFSIGRAPQKPVTPGTREIDF